MNTHNHPAHPMAVIAVILSALFVVGYVLNIVKLLNADFEAPYKTEVIRSIGVVPFIGGIIGWMDIGEENK